MGITTVGCFTPDAIDTYLRGQYDLCKSKVCRHGATCG